MADSPVDSSSEDDVIIVPDPRAEERKRRRDDAEGPADDAVDGGVVPPSGAVAGARHRPSATKLDSARFEIAKSEIVKTVVTRKQHGRSKRVPWTAVETQELERLHLYFEAQGVKNLLWAKILHAGWDTFKTHSRTNIDLKDRWRIVLQMREAAAAAAALVGYEALSGDAEVVPPPPREPEGSDEDAAGRGPRAGPRRRRKGARTLPGPEEEEGQEDTQG